jgi:hypothetical protein
VLGCSAEALLPAKGRKQLEIETSKWDTFAAAIGRILRPAALEK